MKQGGAVLISLLIIIAIYFAIAAVFMLLYNYSVPVIVKSVNSNYDKKRNFKKISYIEACVIILFVSMIFGSSTVVVKQCV